MNVRSRSEHAFSIVEIIIAALLLSVVIAAATAVFAGSSGAGATMRVKDRQTALSNQLLAKLQADPTWANWCHAQPNKATCDVAPWLQQRGYDKLGVLVDSSGTMQFLVSATAHGIDLPTDGIGAKDTDGVYPDVYRIDVTVTPDAALAARHSGLRPMTISAELNPQVRMVSGRVTVDACRASNQIDERMPIADCYATANWADLLPPPTLDTSSNQSIGSRCNGPQSPSRGADDRDCAAFKCADTDIARMGPARGMSCESYPGWVPPSQWPNFVHTFSQVRLEPVNGTVRLRHRESGTVYGPRPFNQGRAEFRGLPVGDYDVLPNVAGSDRLWQSKSVPSTRIVTVEAGINSRAVLVYRPQATGSITIPIRSVDASIPWYPAEYNGWAAIDKSGNLLPPSPPVEICLVPVPKGRVLQGEVPCQKFPRALSTTQFTFTGVEPGLYSAELSMGGYTSFLPLEGSAGFIWIPDKGAPFHSMTGSKLEYVEGLCAEYVRAPYENATWDPVNLRAISPPGPCNSPGGGVPPGGGGGGGMQ